MKIMVIDQYVLFRQEIVRLLKCQPDFEIVGDGTIGGEMIKQAFRYQPDVVLMGSTLFEEGGREMMNDVLSVCPDMAFILLAPVDSIELLLEALQYGAKGYLPKNISESALIRSLYAVEQGELAVSRSMMAMVVSELRKILAAILKSENNVISSLTHRDRQILGLMATEGSNQDIARHLLTSDNLARANAHNMPQATHHPRETAKSSKRIGVNGRGPFTD